MGLKRAFTLIELLVVIAIIAILAAILFPVFAQAKAAAKKTTSLSNLKQIGTGTYIYLTDSDDVYPIYQVPVSAGFGYSWGIWWAVPSSWYTGTNPLYRNIHDVFVMNTQHPYMKNQGIMEEPMGRRVDIPGGAYGVGAPPATVQTATNYAYNGLLHGYNATAVTAPAKLTLWWNGSGKANFRGIGQANPDLICNNINVGCHYQPMRNGCGPSINGEWSVTYGISQGTGWNVHTRGLNYVYCDSHAKWRRNGVFTTGYTDPRTDPHSRYNGEFTAGQWYDQYYCHSYLFRPDFDFETWDPAIE